MKTACLNIVWFAVLSSISGCHSSSHTSSDTESGGTDALDSVSDIGGDGDVDADTDTDNDADTDTDNDADTDTDNDADTDTDNDADTDTSTDECPGDAMTFCENDSRVYCGFTFDLWAYYGDGCMTARADGTFSVEWNEVREIYAFAGLTPGSREQIVTYEADFAEEGDSILEFYGVGRNDDASVLLQVVENWGDLWRPPEARRYMGSFESDGGTYDVYHDRYPIGINPAYRFWSVRTERRSSGTITLANHIAAWESFDMVFWDLRQVAMLIEAHASSGAADITSLSMTTAP